MDINVELDFEGDVRAIQAQSCSWGLTNPGSGGNPQGQSVSQDFVLTAPSSPHTSQLLALACETGARLTRVTISVLDPGQGGGVKWTLENGFVSSFQTGADASQSPALDTFSINFQSFTVEVA